MRRPMATTAPPEGATGDPAQLDRMAEEVGHLLARLLAGAHPSVADRLLDEAAWWSDVSGASLLTAVQRGFAVRQLVLRTADSDGSWRNSLSYIGDPSGVDEAVCTYDYERAEVRFPPESPLARPYSWVRGEDCAVETWYARNGMSAITAWLIAVARMASERGRPHLVLTNRLYHETEILFHMARLSGVVVHKHDTVGELLTAAHAAEDPVTVFLDSSRPDGGAEAVTRVLRELDPGKVGCVLWDNTCCSSADNPFETVDGHRESTVESPVVRAELNTTLVVLRSHAKLDQLGLELCSLGSVAMVTTEANTGEGPLWLEGMQRFFADALAVTGACVSPATLRLLAAVDLPNEPLSARANRHLRAANVLAGAVLKDKLDGVRYAVEENEHGCFVEVHLLELPGPEPIGGPPTWPLWDDLDAELTLVEQHAARRSIPVWKSASFGFHYTGLSWYAAEDPPRPQGHPHTVLRVCFGMHDPAVTTEAAEIIAEHLTRKQSWT
ncbi:hypothetical protein [Actinokineospora terrae]|uniref:Aspartate/methionine/tyrosine aminotransferase n=1 Tax=Actinokineospora terrae TaxID=155974 RepID=A0A1H9KVE7_9PSEU|nr:hypothetical protein [Actinokineospora terrae]SER03120.1 hypothetical protein SAMN04487818_101338 [Actinokineospora terrae]